MDDLTCEKCGNKFPFYQSKGRPIPRFCNSECRRTEGCQGTKDCEKCGKTFFWRRGKKQPQPRFCSYECKGHTGFRPGGEIRLSELTDIEKSERFKESFYKNAIVKEGCWGWRGALDQGGYPVMSCRKALGPDRGHRASWVIHKGAIPKGLFVCHSCDNPTCTNPDHLWLGTQKENNDDKIRKCRTNNIPPPHKRGSENGGSKLKDDQVREIRVLLEKGLTSRAIGKQYDVSKTTVLRIRNKTHWKHIGDNNETSSLSEISER